MLPLHIRRSKILNYKRALLKALNRQFYYFEMGSNFQYNFRQNI